MHKLLTGEHLELMFKLITEDPELGEELTNDIEVLTKTATALHELINHHSDKGIEILKPTIGVKGKDMTFEHVEIYKKATKQAIVLARLTRMVRDMNEFLHSSGYYKESCKMDEEVEVLVKKMFKRSAQS
jgi:hypothetical protein